MEPIKIVYDEKGNTLYIRFSDKEERYCTESDIGKEVIFSRAEDGNVIGFEILNYLPKDMKMPATLPVEAEILKAS
ncbi:MAG: DUF2283 domain-containing protein [Nitrospirota bacterium]